ncbi:alpha/beta hydrolase [Congregibacter sp.]|uniref:alpha/beta hydrolase n=1 Tax=Congregibacter sp. TaxID=2744308 RepID=UPI003F6B7A85
MKKTLTPLIFGVALAACSGPSVQPLMPTPVLFSELQFSPMDHIPEAQRWSPRLVYYATTRQRKNDLQRLDYGNNEANDISVGMTLVGFGSPQLSWDKLSDYSREGTRDNTVDLSIAGLVEIGRFQPSSNETALFDQSGALAWLMNDMNAAIEASRDDDLMIYVHGAKVNFYNANAFAAQLDHFMGRDMTSIAFSWPTRQSIVAYGSGSDVRRAYRAAPALTSVLETLAENSVARRIHIVCWSAGGRVVTAALKELYDRHASDGVDLREKFRLGTIYYAAADVPQSEFVDALPAINALSSRTVVTVSSKDGALDMAKLFMGGGARIGQRAKNLGADTLEAIAAADRLEVVDVSRDWEGRGFDITGHRYWFDHPWASTDVLLSIRSDFSPLERGLAPTDQQMLWSIPADYPQRLQERLGRGELPLRSDDMGFDALPDQSER